MVNNAALLTETASPKKLFDDADEETYEANLRVNTASTFYGAKYAARQMKNQNLSGGGTRGNIVNISSICALKGYPGIRKSEYLLYNTCKSIWTLSANGIVAGYTASKAAIMALTRSVAIELAQSGIVCNCIGAGCTLPSHCSTTISIGLTPGWHA